ncbi:hypothetical protein OAN96_01660 [Candidatus Gracilibacteria bacterium]|nr:hypothetical protein [Candidatus Gracilibacteria bacterium]
MNYQALKTMIDSVTSNYKCPSCNSSVSEESLDIIGAAGTSVNIDITCPACEKHSMIKAEVMNVDVSNMKIGSEQLGALQEKISQIKGLTGGSIHMQPNSSNRMKDEQIVNLNKNLKQKDLKVEDLFGE